MDAQKKYLEDGYYIKRGLIDAGKISKLLKSFESFKNRGGIYYSQSNHNWRNARKDLDEYGLCEKSFENFTDLLWAPDLSKYGKDILLSKDILEYLCKLSGTVQDYCMWQNMFFDKSTGTVDHIDTWYLDTDPMGYLIAAWVALEDIDGNGGEFHVYPGSHLSEFVRPENWKDLDHDKFVDWSKNLGKEYKRTPIHIKKGDVLFWHPSLLHGSSNQKIEGHSRKSLTAHYLPCTCKRGGGGASSDPSTEVYRQVVAAKNKRIRQYGSLPIFSDRNRVKIKRSLIGAMKFAFHYQNKDFMLMERSVYEEK